MGAVVNGAEDMDKGWRSRERLSRWGSKVVEVGE
jgi:hypothetical protein